MEKEGSSSSDDSSISSGDIGLSKYERKARKQHKKLEKKLTKEIRKGEKDARKQQEKTERSLLKEQRKIDDKAKTHQTKLEKSLAKDQEKAEKAARKQQSKLEKEARNNDAEIGRQLLVGAYSDEADYAPSTNVAVVPAVLVSPYRIIRLTRTHNIDERRPEYAIHGIIRVLQGEEVELLQGSLLSGLPPPYADYVLVRTMRGRIGKVGKMCFS